MTLTHSPEERGWTLKVPHFKIQDPPCWKSSTFLAKSPIFSVMGTIDKNGGVLLWKFDIIAVRKVVKKWRLIRLRTLAKNAGLVQITGKCSQNKINSNWGILQKNWGNLHMGILYFRMRDFECSSRESIVQYNQILKHVFYTYSKWMFF